MMTDWILDVGEGQGVPVSDRAELAQVLEKYSAQRDERPFIVQLVGPPGSLGFGVGRHRTLLEHIPPNGDPPYHESRGSTPAGDIVVYFFGGDWTEFDSEAEVQWIDANGHPRVLRQRNAELSHPLGRGLISHLAEKGADGSGRASPTARPLSSTRPQLG